MALLRKLFFSLFLLVSTWLNAQQTLVIEDPVAQYNMGLELYDKEKFAAASTAFKAYLEKGEEFQLRILSEFYMAFCAIRLEQADAEQQMLDILESHPDHPKTNYARFLLGTYYYAKNNLSHSINYFEQCDPLNLTVDDQKEYRFDLGYAYFTKHKYTESQEQLRKIENNKDKYYYPCRYYLAYMAMEEGNDDKALSYFTSILKSRVYGEKAPIYIARIYYRKGMYKEVISFTDSIHNNPEQADISWERAKAYYQLKSYQEAINNFKSGRGTRDLSNEDKYMLGMAYYMEKDYESAYVNFTSIHDDKDPLRQNALMYSGQCFLELDKKTNARNAFLEASKLDTDPKQAELAYFLYAKLSLEPPFQAEAVACLKKFVDTYPNSVYADEAKGYLGEALLNSRKYADAIPVLESISQKDNRIKKTYQEICYYYANELLRDDPDASLKYFEKAKVYPINSKLDAMVDFWTGEIWYNKGNYSNAGRDWKKFLANSSAKETNVYKDGMYNLAYVYFNGKEYGKAAEQFKAYTKIESYSGDKARKYIDGMTRLADCYFVEKNYEAAEEAYAYVTSKDAPTSDYAYFQMAMIQGLKKNGSLYEKMVTLKRIPAKYPNSEYVDDALYEMAMVHLQQQNYQEALRGLSFLIEDYPNGIYTKRAQLNRGLALLNLNRYDDAIAAYTEVVKMAPKDQHTEAAIQAVKEIYTDQARGDELLPWLENVAKERVSVSYADSTLYTSAIATYRAGKCDKAIQNFSNYLQQFPEGYFSTEARFYRSECLYSQKKYEESLNGYLYAIQKNYAEFLERANLHAAAIYLGQKKNDLAIPRLESLERLANTKENLIYAQVNLMYGYYGLEKWNEARSAANKVLSNEKAQAIDKRDANLIVAQVYMKEGEWDKAEPYFSKVEKAKENKNAKGAEAKYGLAKIQFEKGDYKKCTSLIYELDEKYSNQIYWVAKAYLLLSEVHLKQNDLFNARAVLKSLVENYPKEDDGIKSRALELLDKANSLENKQGKE